MLRVTSAPALVLALIMASSVAALGASPAETVRPEAVYGRGRAVLRVATGAPGELGLLRALAEAWSRKAHTRVEWFKAGTGAALRLLKERRVDLAMAHGPDAEAAAVREGWATGRTLLGGNEFYLVGPAADPAGVATAPTAVSAFGRIAAASARFVSRGDDSGTNQRELVLWRRAGVIPAGDRYVVAKGFMSESMHRADALGAYYLTDSSTWVVERPRLTGLRLLFKGDQALANDYHALRQPDGATRGARAAARFVAFVASPAGQAITRNFGRERYGEPLYLDAASARRFEP